MDYVAEPMNNGPTYQYVLVSDKDQVIQFDWKMFYRPEKELIYKGEEVKIPQHFFGKRLGDFWEDDYYFMKPR